MEPSEGGEKRADGRERGGGLTFMEAPRRPNEPRPVAKARPSSERRRVWVPPHDAWMILQRESKNRAVAVEGVSTGLFQVGTDKRERETERETEKQRHTERHTETERGGQEGGGGGGRRGIGNVEEGEEEEESGGGGRRHDRKRNRKMEGRGARLPFYGRDRRREGRRPHKWSAIPETWQGRSLAEPLLSPTPSRPYSPRPQVNTCDADRSSGGSSKVSNG